jgi:hypothetical protein
MEKITRLRMPGSLATLGLIIERPHRTVAEIAEELDERFAEAQYDPATAWSSIKRMRDEENPRLEVTHLGEGRSRKDDRFGPTTRGIEEFDEWMRMYLGGVPPVREALYGRMELCRGPNDLPDLIRIAAEESVHAKAQFTATKNDLTHERERKRRRRGHGEFAGFLQEIQGMLQDINPEYWSDRSIRFDLIATKLEKLAEREGVPFTPHRR